MSIKWTNTSVLALQVSDPIAYVTERSRRVVLEAIEAGWPGPPYDPIALARHLGLRVEPREDLADARIVALGAKKLQIEFNPAQSAGRVRFSIAHEIAHSFFPDCAEQVRYRSKSGGGGPDAWQLEMLCNLAAAELVMPIGSFSELADKAPSLDVLMQLRRTLDVSIEAIMIRFAKLTQRPTLLLGVSRLESGADSGRYRIDYSLPSSGWTRIPPAGSLLPDSTCASECTAIGYTAKAAETWPKIGRVQVECVGAPAYRAARFPRALCLVTDEDDERDSTAPIKQLQGDALQPRGTGKRLLVQVVNDRSEAWGGGFARAVAAKHPEAQRDYREWRRMRRGADLLGEVHCFGGPLLSIASIVAQSGYGPSVSPRLRYPALQAGLKKVAELAKSVSASVHMPKIGSGQAGGHWEVILEMVRSEIASKGIAVTVYTLP